MSRQVCAPSPAASALGASGRPRQGAPSHPCPVLSTENPPMVTLDSSCAQPMFRGPRGPRPLFSRRARTRLGGPTAPLAAEHRAVSKRFALDRQVSSCAGSAAATHAGFELPREVPFCSFPVVVNGGAGWRWRSPAEAAQFPRKKRRNTPAVRACWARDVAALGYAAAALLQVARCYLRTSWVRVVPDSRRRQKPWLPLTIGRVLLTTDRFVVYSRVLLLPPPKR